ncbi:MAG: DUF1538 domain-containing protein [Desulfobacteraceae bacterium]|nr:DUF1538 domain-containing protein [Desulfobacterales bacterium]MBL6967046.1 DUF1538 domain-containing protein [Desulfobacteraceae bacterium]MBL7171681.1 DUF1538 domain-containing protein [Desulfobacteraceae bacterium]
MELLNTFVNTLALTVKDVFPVVALLVFFQLVVLRRPIPNWKRVVVGFVFVLVGLALFLDGLETALFPIGKIMAKQLSAPEFVFGAKTVPTGASWHAYVWVYVFGALIGFATTVAEPALIAVSFKAQEVSRGALNQWGLRLAVAVGVAIGIGIGTFRIVTGTPLFLYIIAGYVIVVVQTIFAPREIIPLAYDSGGVTTSTVTVPLVAALGLGLSETVPGRNPALDGFGLIAFASVFPIITVLGYAQIARWLERRSLRAAREE